MCICWNGLLFLQSLDYDICENHLLLQEVRKKGYKFVTKKNMARWLVFLLIGVITACIACFIDVSIEQCFIAKFSVLTKCILSRDWRFSPSSFWIIVFCPLDTALVLTSDNFLLNFPPSIPFSQPPDGTFQTLSNDTIFVVSSHTFTLFWLRKSSVTIKIFWISFRVFVCVFSPEISSIFGKSFPFPFPYFVLNYKILHLFKMAYQLIFQSWQSPGINI